MRGAEAEPAGPGFRCAPSGLLFPKHLVALLGQPVEFVLLLGDAVGVARLVAGAGEGSGLLDQLTDVVAHDGDAVFDFRK